MSALTLLLTLVVGLFLVFGSGGSASHTRRIATSPTSPSHRVPRLLVRLAPHALPRRLSGEAVVAQGAGVLVIGGLNSSDESTIGVYELSSGTGRFKTVGSLSEPRHDTAAASLGGSVLVFGGGSVTELDSVESLRGGGSGKPLGHLPSTRSDLSVLALNGSAYVLGGYDGQAPAPAILRTTDGRHFVVAGRLPVPFRYAAAATLGGTIYTFGGELASGADSDAIQAFDTRTARTRVIGHLHRPLSHASAVALGARIYVLGGRTAGNPSDRILSFDPSTRTLRTAGRLPMPVTNAAAASVGDIGYLIGGLDAQGGSLASVIEVRLAGPGR